MYRELGMLDKVADLVIRWFDREIHGGFGLDAYEVAMYYFITSRDAENLIRVAEYISDNFVHRYKKEDMEIVIDLAKQERWDIIDSLVEIK